MPYKSVMYSTSHGLNQKQNANINFLIFLQTRAHE